MKTRAQELSRALLLVALLSTLNLGSPTVFAQGTAFTYQGRLNDGGSIANGSYDIAFTLFATNTTGTAVAGPVTNPAVGVSNGLFTTSVNFGPGIFTGTNYWLEIAVSTNGADAFSTLAPRQPLTPTPYAIFAAGANAAGISGTVPAANISGTYGNAVNFNNGLDSFDGTFSGSFIGNGSGLSNVWHNTGDLGTTPGVNFLGTLDNQRLIIKVNGQQAYELVPTAGAPNVVGGYGSNFIAAGLTSATIAGGGSAGAANRITGAGSGSFIGGGGNNEATSFNAVVAGGANNSALANASTISGGSENAVSGDHDTIAGGQHNTTTNGNANFIGGGLLNSIPGGGEIVINGGFSNYNIGFYSTIGGGDENSIGIAADHATIGGGYNNTIFGSFGQVSDTIGGGYQNTVQTNVAFGSIGGGIANLIQSNSTSVTIGGGTNNVIQTGSTNSVIAGGMNNVVQPFSFAATISGGYNNIDNGAATVIGGGHDNTIQSNAGPSTIGGGYQNTIQSNNAANVIAGGVQNQIQSYATYSTIGGGAANIIMGNSNFWSRQIEINNTIAGGAANEILPNGGYSFIGGGVLNVVGTNSGWNTIGGGALNLISNNVGYATIAGGEFNSILPNATNASIGGGISNQVGGLNGTVPGGSNNLAGGINSFAAGTDAQATNDGSFVLTDGEPTNFYSTTSNQLSGRFSGGVRFVTAGAGMTVDGQSVVSGSNGTGLTNVNAATLGGLPSSGFWKTTGNAGTTPGANFVGTTDGQALLLKAPFVGVGRTNKITFAEYFGVEAPVGSGTYGGMYVNTTNANAWPFYGYSQAGIPAAYHYVDASDTNKWKLVMGVGVCMTATQDGKVGIGTTTPDATLSVVGAADKTGGGSWNVFSDARLKDVGANFTDGLDALEAIQPVTYHYKADNPLKLPSQPEYIGVVAQQVQKAVPEAVQQSPSGYLTVNNDPIIWTMVNAIKELNHKMDEKETENAQLKQQLAELKAEVQQLARAQGK